MLVNMPCSIRRSSLTKLISLLRVSESESSAVLLFAWDEDYVKLLFTITDRPVCGDVMWYDDTDQKRANLIFIAAAGVMAKE